MFCKLTLFLSIFFFLCFFSIFKSYDFSLYNYRKIKKTLVFRNKPSKGKESFNKQMTKKATEFLEANKNFLMKNKGNMEKKKKYCLGITTTFPRPNGINYLNRTMASIVKNIPKNNWKDFYIFIFSTSMNRQDETVEKLSTYFNVFHFDKSDPIYRNGWYHEHHKHMFDYAKVLQFCSKSNSQYSIILEDDCVLKSDFFNQLENLIEKTSKLENFLWVKLYFDDKYRNFEKEDFKFLVLSSLSISSIIYLFFTFISIKSRQPLSLCQKFSILFWFTCLFILLIAMCGKQNLFPLKNGDLNKFQQSGRFINSLQF
jgi:hypothetical protein